MLLFVQQPHALSFFCERALTLTRRQISLSTISIPWTDRLSHSEASHSLILRLCSSAQSLKQVKRTHALAVLTGSFHHSVSVSSALMLAYAAFGSSSASSLLFHRSFLIERHATSAAFFWNTLIRAHSIAGSQCDALATYNLMLRTGIPPDTLTFPFVLKPCAHLGLFAFEKGMEIHALIFKLGFNGDIFVANALISLYALVHLLDAHRVFDEMLQRDIVSWNSIMAAFLENGHPSAVLDWFFKMRLATALKPNSVSVVSVLPACAKLEDEETAREIHGYVVKAGLQTRVTVSTALVDVYAKCGNLEASKLVFDQMVERNVVSWNAVIAGLAREGGLFGDALLLFRTMVAVGETPDSITISSVLPVIVEMRHFHLGKEIHAYTIRKGIESVVFVANCLIDLYAKSGHSKESSNMFYRMDMRNLVTWNSMAANYAMNGLELEAIRLLTTMQVNGEYPDSITFVSVLPAVARMGFLRQGKEIHAVSIREGFNSNLFVSNALTDMYAKCHCLTSARNVFDSSPRDEVSYNILIMGYSQSDYCLESLNLFLEMRFIGLKHEPVSFMGCLSACANLTMFKQGKEIHGLLVRACQSHLFVINSLLTLYTKCGRVDLARKVFNQMPNKDVASWNTMIFGYGMQGELEAAVDLFDAMSIGGVDYDSISYIAVLSACSHGGLVERGVNYFNDMISQDIKPTNMHYACLVDLLGRAGLVEEAAELIRGLPIEPNEDVWGALLGACRVYGNIELGRWAAERLIKLKPEHGGCYVLLSNIYSEAGKWEEANRIRESMDSRGVRKHPGCSRLEISDPMRVRA